MFPHVDDLPQETSMWLAWSGQDTVMSHHIWYTIDWLGTQQYRELGRVSRSRVLLWLLTSLQASPEPSNHRRGWVWDFPDTKYMVFPPTIQFPAPNRPPIVHWLLISYLWSQGRCHRLRYQECPDLRCQPSEVRALSVLELSCFWTSDWKWNFPPYLHSQKLNQTSKQTQENSESLFWE